MAMVEDTWEVATVEVAVGDMEDTMEATRVATVEAGVATSTREVIVVEGLEQCPARAATMEASPSTGAQVEAMAATVGDHHGVVATWEEGDLVLALV